jgi:hypothetical protein
VEIAKSAGFNSPQLAALGLNLSFTDTPWLAAGEFIVKVSIIIETKIEPL